MDDEIDKRQRKKGKGKCVHAETDKGLARKGLGFQPPLQPTMSAPAAAGGGGMPMGPPGISI